MKTANTDYEIECQKLKDRMESICAENQELKCSLDMAQARLEELESSNNSLLMKVEFLKGQIEAYQFIANCRR